MHGAIGEVDQLVLTERELGARVGVTGVVRGCCVSAAKTCRNRIQRDRSRPSTVANGQELPVPVLRGQPDLHLDIRIRRWSQRRCHATERRQLCEQRAPRPAFGALKAPAATRSALVTLACGSASDASDSHDRPLVAAPAGDELADGRLRVYRGTSKDRDGDCDERSSLRHLQFLSDDLRQAESTPREAEIPGDAFDGYAASRAGRLRYAGQPTRP